MPSQATLTTPPLVEYVAVGRVGAKVVAGAAGEVFAATVVDGVAGGLTDGGVVPADGTVEAGTVRGTVVRGRVVGVGAFVVVVEDLGSGEPDCNWLTTSR